MDREAEIKRIVSSQWSEYADMAGEEYLDTIISGVEAGQQPEFESTRGGDNFELVTVLAILAAATTIIKNGLDIYKSHCSNPDHPSQPARL